VTPDPAEAPSPSSPPAPDRGPRVTARGVKIVDALAGAVVRTGGLLVILAVVGILVFLVATVLPLFSSAEVRASEDAGRVPVEGSARSVALDEYRILAAAIGDAPEVVVFRPDTGEVVARTPIAGLEGARVSSARRSVRSKDVAIGTTDGRLAFARIGFESDYILGPEGGALRSQIALGGVRTMDGAVVQRRPGGTLLRMRAAVEVRGVIRLAGGAVVAASYASSDEAGLAAAVTADGAAHLVREDPQGGAERFRVEEPAGPGPAVPEGLFVALVDEELRTAWFASRGGTLVRVDALPRPAVRREVRQTELPSGARLTAVEFLIGDRSLVVAHDRGGLSIWSPAPVPPVRRWLTPSEVEQAAARGDPAVAAVTPERLAEAKRFGTRLLVESKDPKDPGDGYAISRLHDFDPFESPAVVIASCPTRRTFYLGHADGSLTMAYSTNERLLARHPAFKGPIETIAVGEKDDGLLVSGPGGGFRGFEVDAPHPETNFHALFRPVHYEGYSKPEYFYQSASATDEAETKLSLWPLLFGTLKATFYAMLFALPLALLGAIYTSQFMHPRVRAVVKPGVEVMASLPSVVLGFVAALVLAPAIEKVVPGIFASVAAIGAVGFGAGVVWYVLPPQVRARFGSAWRLAIAGALVAATIWLCLRWTPAIERALFSSQANPTGDFRAWLNAPKGAAPGLALLRLGMGVFGAVVGMVVLPRILRVDLPRAPAAVASIVKVATYVVAPALAFALLAGPVESLVFGGDFRWFLVGTDDPGAGIRYDQRNSIVVGIAMGFAVIPIIYTIAEDALSAIPDSLRSAALGCGASPWQAAIRVVVPAAVPGIFSAIMIGLGRAIGETMIVLMAAGGTAILDLTMFNGFRTLSVNIATELPEAPIEGTLYRVLFLAGLLLFVLTFALNTAAEAVRIRFRKKFKGL
jgi:phosphate transport system permease protein